jgi:hypothetical protein
MKPSCALTATALFAFVASSNSFVTTPTSFVARKNLSRQCMLPDVSSLVTAVEVFDGSSIVSPEVISTVFWTSLKGKIIAVVLGQVLAAVAFALLSSLLASQISQLGSFATKTFFGGSPEANDKKATTKTFIKAGQAEKQVTPDFGKLCICLAIDVSCYFKRKPVTPPPPIAKLLTLYHFCASRLLVALLKLFHCSETLQM